MTATLSKNPCQDCETGRCLCGDGCDHCAHTGECVSCHGLGYHEGARAVATAELDPEVPVGRCAACGRNGKEARAYRRGGDAYAGLTLEQRIARSEARKPYPYCGACGRSLGSDHCRPALLAAAADALVHTTSVGTKERRNWERAPVCVACGRRERGPTAKDPMAGLTPEERTVRLNNVETNRLFHGMYRCSVCARPLKFLDGEYTQRAILNGALVWWEPNVVAGWIMHSGLRPGDVERSVRRRERRKRAVSKRG